MGKLSVICSSRSKREQRGDGYAHSRSGTCCTTLLRHLNKSDPVGNVSMSSELRRLSQYTERRGWRIYNVPLIKDRALPSIAGLRSGREARNSLVASQRVGMVSMSTRTKAMQMEPSVRFDEIQTEADSRAGKERTNTRIGRA
jgi:hypothetical protein